MADVDLALQDESQQYGNLDEASAIARMPRKCLVMWLGDLFVNQMLPGTFVESCFGAQ